MLENTGKLFLESAEAMKPEWYLASGDQSVGPLSAAEILTQLQAGRIGLAHYVWANGMADWKRIFEVPAFRALVPQTPDNKRPEPPISTAVIEEKKDWFVFAQGTQYGPFTVQEVKNLLTSKRINPSDHAWKDGLTQWESIAQLNEFSTRAVERRVGPRKIFLAKVVFADGDGVRVGTCRDLSIGGMQVLIDLDAPAPGKNLSLNISPPDLKKPTFEAFTAKGRVVRVLEDGRGFSFRFESMNDRSQKILQSLITSESQSSET